MSFRIRTLRHAALVAALATLLGAASVPVSAAAPDAGFDPRWLDRELRGLGASLDSAPGCSTGDEGESDGICRDLARFACAPGSFDDGTGIAGNADAGKKKLGQIGQEAAPAAIARYRAALADPSNEYFRRTAMSGLGLALSPECRGAATRARCDDRLATGLAEFSLKRLLIRVNPEEEEARPGQDALKPAVRDLDFLRVNPVLQKTEASLFAELHGKIVDTDIARKVEHDIFPQVREAVARAVGRSIPDPVTRDRVVTKIRGIHFAGFDCNSSRDKPIAPNGMPDTRRGAIPVDAEPNAFYRWQDNSFTVCAGMLMSSTSEFQLAQVISHELGHSSDACRITTGPSDFTFKYSDPGSARRSEREYPLPNLIGCLRRPESVGAHLPETPDMAAARVLANAKAALADTERALRAGKLDPERRDDLLEDRERQRELIDLTARQLAQLKREADWIRKNPEKAGPGPGPGGGNPPEPTSPTSPFCGKGDQINEAIADWIADEALPDYIERAHPNLSRDQFRTGYANVMRPMCNNSDPWRERPASPEVHPDSDRRIDRLLLVNPRIRRQMGCETKPPPGMVYCSPGGAR